METAEALVEDTFLVVGTVLVGIDLAKIAAEDTFLVVGTVPEAFVLGDILAASVVEGIVQECTAGEPWVAVLEKLLVDWYGD